MLFDITFEVAGFFLIILFLGIYLDGYYREIRINKIYIFAIVMAAVYCISDIGTAYTISFYYMVPRWLNYLCNAIYYLALPLVGLMFWEYATSWFDNYLKFMKETMRIIFVAYLLGLLYNPETKFYFYIDEAGRYLRGEGYLIATIVSYFYVVCTFILLLQNYRKFDIRNHLLHWLMAIINVCGFLGQILNPTCLVGGISVIFTVIIALFAFETPDYIKLMQTLEELEKSREAEKEAHLRAIYASEEKSQFLAIMSHQIRSPLNVILGLDEMILRESRNEEIRSYALKMKNSGQTLLGTINDILDFSKIESGKFELNLEEYNLGDVISSLADLEKNRAEKKGLEFILDIDNSLPEILYGDSVRLRQVITNLLTNAIKYTSEGSVSLIMRGTPDGDKLDLYVEVKDTGIGIKDEDKSKLFGLFERIENAVNRNIEGTGLGMNITQSLLKLMGAELMLETKYQKGSRFFFTISQGIISNKAIGDINENIRRKAADYNYIPAFSAPEVKILAVDDKDLNLFVVKKLLKKTLIHVSTVLSGREAIEILKLEKFDLVLLDHMMPELDGVETLRILRNENICNDTPVVVLTANAMVGVEKNYLEEGFAAYLSKPISQEALEKTIMELVSKDKIMPAVEIFEEDELNSEKKAIYEKVMKLPAFDVKKAISDFDSIESYLEVLERFAMSFSQYKDDITTLYEKIDGADSIKDYRIAVHSMKSSARMVGLNNLSELSRQSEDYARSEDKEGIDSIYGVLSDELNLTQNYLNEIFDKEEEDTDDDVINVSVLLAALELVRQALTAFDMAAMDENILLLKNQGMPGTAKPYRRELELAINNLDTTKGLEIIDKLNMILKGEDS